jgi:cysteine-rich repeat protein
LQVFKAWKNDKDRKQGVGCPIMNGPNQDCKATVLGNMKALLTAVDCNDKFGNDAAKRDAARANQECWRCGDNFVDPNEECDVGDLLEDKGCSRLCRILPPPPPSVVVDTPASYNNTGDGYCSPNSDGVVCQNCADTCQTGDKGGTDGDQCQLPSSMGGSISEDDVCSLPGQGLGRKVLVTRDVSVRYTARNGTTSFTKIGTLYLLMRRAGRISATMRMTCPWLLWSTPSVSVTALFWSCYIAARIALKIAYNDRQLRMPGCDACAGTEGQACRHESAAVANLLHQLLVWDYRDIDGSADTQAITCRPLHVLQLVSGELWFYMSNTGDELPHALHARRNAVARYPNSQRDLVNCD